jgi:hypothetical protein
MRSVRATVTQTVPEPAVRDGVLLEYTGAGVMMVRGPATGRAYLCSGGKSIAVERRDADALRRTRLFR